MLKGGVLTSLFYTLFAMQAHAVVFDIKAVFEPDLAARKR
jgi:hypothetical protein